MQLPVVWLMTYRSTTYWILGAVASKRLSFSGQALVNPAHTSGSATFQIRLLMFVNYYYVQWINPRNLTVLGGQNRSARNAMVKCFKWLLKELLGS